MSTLDTSATARRAITGREMAQKQREIYDIVVGCQRNGQPDMSLTEIRDTFERLHGRRIDLNRVSSRVSELVSAGRLVRATGTRPCSITSRSVEPVSVPPQQGRLCV